MKELVEYIVKQLVSNPDDVVVEETTDGSSIYLLLSVNPEDMGMVIGKSGQTIKSIRRILTIKAMADNVRVNLELKDSGRPKGEAMDDNTSAKEADLDVTEEIQDGKKADSEESKEAGNPDTNNPSEILEDSSEQPEEVK